MDDILKSEVGQVSKAPVDKPADRDFDNPDTWALQNTMPAAEKHEAKQLDIGEIKDNQLPCTPEVAEIEEDDGSYKHHLNATGTREHPADTPLKISGNKELKQKTSHKSMSVTQQSEPSVIAVIAVGSNADGENLNLESVYDEDASVFDDELAYNDGCLDYETSSMSVDIFTDRAVSEESPTDDKPRENVSFCHDDLQAVESGKPSPKVEAIGMSVNSDDEMSVSTNVAHHIVTPTKEKLQQEEQYKVSGVQSKKDTVKTKNIFPEPHSSAFGRSELAKSSSDKNSNIDVVSVVSNKHIAGTDENAENLSLLQLDKVEAAETGCLTTDKTVQQFPMSPQSSLGTRQRSLQSGVISSHDDDNKDDGDLGSLVCNEHISETGEGTQNISPVQINNIQAVTTGLVVVDENLKQHQASEKSSLLSSQKASQNGIISRHDSVSLDRLPSSGSSRNDSDWHLVSLFENTSDINEAVTPVSDNTSSKRYVLSATSLDRHKRSNCVQKSAPVCASNERMSNIKLRSLRSCSPSASSSDCHLRSLDDRDVAADGGEERKSSMLYEKSARDSECSGRISFQDSAADSGGKRKSDVMPSPLQHLTSSRSSSNWHLASMFYEKSARGSECSGRISYQDYAADDGGKRKSDVMPSPLQHLNSSRNSSNWNLASMLYEDSARDSECSGRISYQGSAADGGGETKSKVVPSPIQHLSSSCGSSDWHLASMLYEESACDSECSERESTAWNLSLKQSSANSSRSSATTSEWHIRSLLFKNSDVSSRQLSGDLHAWVLSDC